MNTVAILVISMFVVIGVAVFILIGIQIYASKIKKQVKAGTYVSKKDKKSAKEEGISSEQFEANLRNKDSNVHSDYMSDLRKMA
jgi:hypothetical protein